MNMDKTAYITARTEPMLNAVPGGVIAKAAGSIAGTIMVLFAAVVVLLFVKWTNRASREPSPWRLMTC
jgi:hypothetical protein